MVCACKLCCVSGWSAVLLLPGSLATSTNEMFRFFEEIRSFNCSFSLCSLDAQLEARKSELAELRASPAATSNADDDGFDGEATEASAELRRLRVDLDKKGSELDTTMKECEAVRAELKEVKGMLGAAASAAGAAGADEESLRKRVSQLMCENGLLRGEKDRQEVLAAEVKNEAKANTSRSAAEVERLEREVDRLSGVVASKADGVAAEGDRAKAALSAMEAKLSELRQERAELQVRESSRIWCWC